MVDVRRESSAYQQLCRDAGVAIARPFPPLTTYARITIGTMDEMRKALPIMIPLLTAPARTTPPVLDPASATRRWSRRSSTSTAVERSRAVSCTRRTFLERVGQAGGSIAVHGAMRALGVAGTPAPAGRLPLERAPAGTRVIILGAGVAGLAAAHELRKLGYEYEILEARARVGGRCFTVRRGQASEEVGTAPQKAAFDPDLYLNAGAARIPHHHTPTLDYCRELGVAIEPFCSVNEAAYVYQSNADPARQRLRLREVRADWRGQTAELLAKAVSSDSLDRPLSADDRERILEWLRLEGGLSPVTPLRRVAAPGICLTSRRGRRDGRRRRSPAARGTAAHGIRQVSRHRNQHADADVPGGRRHRWDRPGAGATGRAHHAWGESCRRSNSRPGECGSAIRPLDGDDRQIEGAFCISTLPLTVLRDIRSTRQPSSSRRLPPSTTRTRARSDCNSRGVSGRRTTESLAASHGPIRRSHRFSIRRRAICLARGCSSATTRPAPRPDRWGSWHRRSGCNARSTRGR